MLCPGGSPGRHPANLQLCNKHFRRPPIPFPIVPCNEQMPGQQLAYLHLCHQRLLTVAQLRLPRVKLGGAHLRACAGRGHVKPCEGRGHVKP
eukprot:355014-Chlamydomonas_euryale.AAC.3